MIFTQNCSGPKTKYNPDKKIEYPGAITPVSLPSNE